MAELFDVLVAAQPSNRAAFAAFIAVKTASARTEMVEAAFRHARKDYDPAHHAVESMIHAFKKFGARRNEIAHGRVYNLGEFGFYLGPNNVMPHKFTDKGVAKYQYVAEDIRHYRECFSVHSYDCELIVSALIARASDKMRRTRSSRSRRDKET